MKESHKETAKPDFLTSIFLIGISLVILGLSLAMPKYVEWGMYATPSIAPIIFSSLLLMCGIILFVRSIAARGYAIRITREQAVRFVTSKPFYNFAATLGFVLLYFVLMGRIHFVLISALYLFLNMFYFHSTAWWKSLIISVVTAGLIWYSFNYLFLIPLP
jgi:hypothetical protein